MWLLYRKANVVWLLCIGQIHPRQCKPARCVSELVKLFSFLLTSSLRVGHPPFALTSTPGCLLYGIIHVIIKWQSRIIITIA